MKKHLIFAPLVLAASLLTGTAIAQKPQSPHYARVQYVPPPAFTNSCAVNGVIYGVDAYSRIWAQDAVGRWFILGRIVATPSGYIAIRNDGVQFPAACQ